MKPLNLYRLVRRRCPSSSSTVQPSSCSRSCPTSWLESGGVPGSHLTQCRWWRGLVSDAIEMIVKPWVEWSLPPGARRRIFGLLANGLATDVDASANSAIDTVARTANSRGDGDAAGGTELQKQDCTGEEPWNGRCSSDLVESARSQRSSKTSGTGWPETTG